MHLVYELLITYIMIYNTPLLQDFVNYDNAFQCMMQFPLLKMQHYQLIATKLHSLLKISEVSVVPDNV